MLVLILSEKTREPQQKILMISQKHGDFDVLCHRYSSIGDLEGRNYLAKPAQERTVGCHDLSLPDG